MAIFTGKNFVNKSSSLLNLVSRRNNFHGIQLVTMIEVQKPFNVFNSSFEKGAKFHSGNDTYEIRNFSSGLFFQLFTILESKLNFTGFLLKRKDGLWGARDQAKAHGTKVHEFCFSNDLTDHDLLTEKFVKL